MNPVLVDNIKEHLMFCGLESVAAVGCLFKANCFLCLRVLRFPSSIVRSTHLFTCCPPAMASCPLVWGCMGLPSSMGLQPTVAADGWLLHYHRRSHHPSSLTSQCPSSPLSIPSLLCTGSSPALQCFSPSCSLECTDGPGHAIRPGVGTNTCYRWSSHFNRIINIIKFRGFVDPYNLNEPYQIPLLSKIWQWNLSNRNKLTKLVGKVEIFFLQPSQTILFSAQDLLLLRNIFLICETYFPYCWEIFL